jgi:hypothetical protein
MLVQHLRAVAAVYGYAAKQIVGCIYDMASVHLGTSMELIGRWKDLIKWACRSQGARTSPSN